MANAMVALATTTLGSSASSVTFGSIPATYRDLRLVIQATGVSTASNYGVRINNDATVGNYFWVYMYGDGSATGSGTLTTSTNVLGGGFNSTTIGNSVFDFLDYSATDKHKTVLNRTDNTTDATYATASRWASTAAITTLMVRANNGTSSFAAGSTFSLYGIVS